MTEPKPINRKLQNVIIAGMVIWIIVIVINGFKTMAKQSVPPRKVELIESFGLLWDSSADSLLVLTDEGTVRNPQIYMYLDASESRLILPIWEGNFLFHKLYLTDFEAYTGEIQWQTLLGSSSIDRALGSNSKNIFIVTQEDEKCTPDERGYCDAVRISSYNLSSGEEEWVTYRGNLNRADTFQVNEQIISITGFATRSDFREKISFAADTGEEVAYQDISAHYDSYYQNWNLDQLGFAKSNVVDWSYEQNGQVLYFLTERGKTLWAADPTIPEIVGRVQFDSSPLGQFPYFGKFAVASSDDLVAVYLGDSEQLFVFRFSPDE